VFGKGRIVNRRHWNGTTQANDAEEGFVHELRSAFRTAGIPVRPLDNDGSIPAAAGAKKEQAKRGKAMTRKASNRGS
jgi:hypothetical protein